MIVRQLFDPDTSTYTYLLADTVMRQAALIDPVIEKLERDLRLLQELDCQLLYALDTHVHADHITASGSLRKQTGCQTGVCYLAGVGCADLMLRDGDEIKLGSTNINVIETPGHTNTCLCYVVDGHVFTGDALLIRGCGRTDFQQGDPAKLYDSINNKLFTMDEETLVCPGHDYNGMTISTIGEEKRFNPRLKLDKAGFIHFMNHLHLPNPRQIEQAIPANMACGDRQDA